MRSELLVVGGGIGGLAVALALARRGRSVRVLEQAATFAEVGAGIQLGPNAFRAFDALGIRTAVDRCAVLPEALVMMDAVSGEELASTPTGKTFIARFGQPYGLVHRADLHAVLLDACLTTGRVVLAPSTTVTEVDDSGSHVRVRAEDGTVHEGDALIGADGLWSKVRATLLDDGPPPFAGHIAYRAVLPTSEVPEANRRNAMVCWMGPGAHLVHYPIRSGTLFNLVAVFRSTRYEEGWNVYGDPVELHERFAPMHATVRTLLAKIETWRMWALCDRPPVEHWSRGRITLLGDAAHPMLQYQAQGACQALEDALCIARLAGDGPVDWAPVFLAYEERRRARTARVQLSARRYGDTFHAEGEARERRNASLRKLTPENAMESRAWLYEEVL